MKKRLFLLAFLMPLFLISCTKTENPQQVKNVIYMIGDGMGLAQVSLLQIEEDYAPTAFDRAEGVALTVTRSANNRVTDSAAAGTALASGQKTNNSMLGQLPDATPSESMMAKATKKGLKTGLVVTCTLQHATPGAFYAHVAHRKMNAEITRDMLASDVDVLVGGGRKWLADECAEGGSYFEAFMRKGYQIADDLQTLKTIESGRVLASVAEEHLDRADERGNYLPEAVAQTLKILDNDAQNNGFLLMVEGSQIDFASHKNDSKWLIDEMRDFNRAVNVAMDYADAHPGTLVVVVADHETGGLSIPANKTDFTMGENGVRYEFSTHSHTACMIPVYLYGTGADRITGVMENTELAKKIMQLLELQ